MAWTGKVSWFGGPHDNGISETEGLALIQPEDLGDWWFRRIFLANYDYTKGLARNLEPNAYYIAMRWGYALGGDILPGWDKKKIRQAIFKISANGKFVYAQAADWGPNSHTERLADLSPAILQLLGLATDDEAKIEVLG